MKTMTLAQVFARSYTSSYLSEISRRVIELGSERALYSIYALQKNPTRPQETDSGV